MANTCNAILNKIPVHVIVLMSHKTCEAGKSNELYDSIHPKYTKQGLKKKNKTRKYRFLVDNCSEKGDWRTKASVSFRSDARLLEPDGVTGCMIFVSALCH